MCFFSCKYNVSLIISQLSEYVEILKGGYFRHGLIAEAQENTPSKLVHGVVSNTEVAIKHERTLDEYEINDEEIT